MSEDKETFHYTYSAKQQEEIERIRNKYISKEEDKVEQLRRLDESVTRPGTVAAIIIGVIGTLILGVGMCCTMVWADAMFIPGIVIGGVGIAVIIAAYPVYTHITKRQREKIAPQILKLTEELMR